ncbi:Ig-like domain repeat protein [Methanobrevibacter millerae]|uniref:Polymorphic outer membrane protein repeat-containing protein n=1 Tax=Methanobrevibacter millerae TaxID=230361 RepID=A0A1G5UVL1_9EURY|nr:Ig-like domain repeat protein [Methanobrevibacter millerae]SDA37087.1 polymorphic outer membrane protein repeat-containing protein [Methanobrevibacter millerae]
MKKRLLISLCLVLVFYISIAGASAIGDNNQTLQTASDANEIMTYSIYEYDFNVDESNVTLSVSENEDLLTSGFLYVNGSVNESGTGGEDSPYKTISEAISASSEGDTIFIASGTYFGSDNIALTIDRELSIISYGNEDVIMDGEENSWIWHVSSSNVLIDGITFINAYASNGSAIYYESGSTNNIINNSKFINNYAASCAGAVFYYSGQNSQILNTIFENNTAYSGGAIYYYSTSNNITYINSVFINNSAQTGGALCFDNSIDNINLINLNFTNNKADYGSVLYAGGINSLNLSNDIFLDNQASSISLIPRVNIFNDTISAVWEGGNNIMNAIYASGLENIKLSNVTYWNGDGVVNSDDAEPVFGYSGQNITLEIYNAGNDELLFNETYTTDENASVLFNYSSLSKDNSFKYVIYHVEDSYYTSIEFTDEFNPIVGDFESLQYLVDQASENDVIELMCNYTYTIGIDTCEAITINKNNLTIRGNGNAIDALSQSGIFIIQSETFNLDNVTLKNAYSNGNGGAITFDGKVKDIKFINVTFESNYAELYGGAIFFECDVDGFEFVNATFKSNIAGSDGGAIAFDEEIDVSDGSFENVSFVNNTARYGGAIAYSNKMNASDITISDSEFISNSAKNGGAISYNGATLSNMAYVNVLFMNNANNQSSGSTTGGGAISYYSTTDSTNERIINSTFINNTATYGGGAIYYYSGSPRNYSIINTTFIDNRAKYFGGAIYFSSLKDGILTNITCINNRASIGGSAIFFIRECDNNEISNSIFVNNTGYTIYYYNPQTSGDRIVNSVFMNNDAVDIYASSPNVVANYNWFGNNASNYDKKPYHINSPITLDTWLFLNATADESAIYTGDIHYVKFVLGAYNQSSTSIIDEDYGELTQINLDLTSVNETLSKDQSLVGEDVKFYADTVGTGSITAGYFNAEYTIEFTSALGNSSVAIEDLSVYYGTTIEIIADCIGAKSIIPKLYDAEENDITDDYLEYDGFNITIKNTLNIGTYTLNVTTVVDEDNFNPVSNSSTITVNMASSSVTINNVTDGVYNTTTPVIDYVVVNETSVSFNINNVSGIVVANITSVSDLEIALLALDCGNYTVSIFNAKNENINASNATSGEFVIYRASTAVTINDVTNGVYNTTAPDVDYSVINETSVTFMIENENGTVIENMDIANLTAELIKLNAGDYNITIINNEYGNFNASNDTKAFTIIKANSTVYLDDYGALYGEIVNLTAICENATGIVAVIYDENATYYDLEIDGFNITVAGLLLGHYIINVTTLTDGNYNNASISSNLYIYANSGVTVNDVNAIYNETITAIAVCDNATGIMATVYDENGSEVSADIMIDGFNITISGLGAGNYTLNVTTIVEGYFIPASNSSRIYVKRTSSTIILEEHIDSIYGDVIEIEADCINATGISAKVYDKDGNNVSADIMIDGFNITISGLDAGNYTLNVTTVTDNNHFPSSNVSIISVNKTNSSVYIEDFSGIVGQVILLDAICENATGVTVKLYDDNGTEYSNNIIVGEFKLVIFNLPSGHYIINVTTLVDNNHNPADNSSNLEIKIESTVYVDNIAVTYNETVNLEAVCSNAIGINATLYDENASEVPADIMIDGFNITISGLDAGNYILNTTTIVEGYFASVTVSSSVIVNKANSTVYINDSAMVYGNVIDLTAVCENATAINATIYDENYDTVDANITIDGFNIIINDLNSGNYTLVLTTIVSDNYNSATVNSSVYVDKANSTIGLENADINYGDVLNITAICENATAINATIYDENGDVVDANIIIEDFNIIINDLNAGNYTLEVTNLVDDNHYNASACSSVIVNKVNITLILSNASDINPTESEIIVVGLSDLNIDGNLTYTIDGLTYAVEDFIITLDNLAEGNYTVLVELVNDTNYNYASNYTTFTVSKVDYNISVDSEDIKVNETSYVVIKLPGDATGNVTLTVNNDTQVILINESTVFGLNGILSMVIAKDNLTAGNYSVVAIYNGNDKYNPSNAATNFTVSKFDDYPVELTFENNTISIALPEDATGNVSVEIANFTFSGEIVVGDVIIDVSVLDDGTYAANVYYPGDNKYGEYADSINISVSTYIRLTAPSVVKYYGGSERLYVYLLDKDGQGIPDKTIIISINGMTYSRVTDENGVASLALNLGSGEYDVLVKYAEKEVISVNTTVTVKTTVNGTDIVKMFRNDTQYYATFHDSNGNYLANGAEVNFNINGVFYTRYIYGNNGLARLNINLNQGEYIITAINPVTGEMSSNNITVLSRIVENNDLVKYYRNDSQYVVRIIGDDGKPVGAAESVRFNINGVFYTRSTDENGYVKMNINLQPGDYVITAEYNGCMVSNNIVVKPVLYANDLIKKYGTSDQFRALLIDGHGYPYAGQQITFNIHGVFYNRITDVDGYASLNIKLGAAVDEYIITSTYNGASISNKIIIEP